MVPWSPQPDQKISLSNVLSNDPAILGGYEGQLTISLVINQLIS